MAQSFDVDLSMIRSVLHPTDFSASSELAFAHALKIALAGQTKLYLLHAGGAEEDDIDWSAFPGVRRTLARWGILPADTAPGDVGARLGMQLAKISSRERDPVRAITRFADDHDSDLLVLATHGREGLPRWLHAEVAEPAARKADAPTLFLPSGARGFVDADTGTLQLRNVLIPVDRRPPPHGALRAVERLCRTLAATDVTLHLVHIGEPGDLPPVALEDDARFRLVRSTRSGNVVDEIVAAARECEADLMAMATAGHHGFLDALRGSTTERVLRRAPCPVLAVPAHGAP